MSDVVTVLLLYTCSSAWTSQLNMYRIEASWKLGQWDKMELYLKSVGIPASLK